MDAEAPQAFVNKPSPYVVAGLFAIGGAVRGRATDNEGVAVVKVATSTRPGLRSDELRRLLRLARRLRPLRRHADATRSGLYFVKGAAVDQAANRSVVDTLNIVALG